MTMIAFATYGDRAEFMTDTASYTANGSSFGRCTKHLTLPHLDAAVLTQGDALFGEDAKSGALQASAQVATFDELVKTAPAWLADLWQNRRTESAGRMDDHAVVFLIGWSDAEQSFTAHAFASEQDFTPLRVKNTWAMPCPWSNRPSGLERRRMLAFGESVGRGEAYRAVAEKWTQKPPLARPGSVEEWRALAVTIREQRALEDFGTVYVAGKVIHTRLERGAVTTRVIHEFDDSGEEFARLIAWSHHPQAQMAVCHCGSGLTYRDCHLAEWYADGRTCACGSGNPFDGCCRVASEAPVTA